MADWLLCDWGCFEESMRERGRWARHCLYDPADSGAQSVNNSTTDSVARRELGEGCGGSRGGGERTKRPERKGKKRRWKTCSQWAGVVIQGRKLRIATIPWPETQNPCPGKLETDGHFGTLTTSELEASGRLPWAAVTPGHRITFRCLFGCGVCRRRCSAHLPLPGATLPTPVGR